MGLRSTKAGGVPPANPTVKPWVKSIVAAAQRRPEAYLRRTALEDEEVDVRRTRSTKAGGVPPANRKSGPGGHESCPTLNEGRRRTSGEPFLDPVATKHPNALNEGRRRTSGEPALEVLIFQARHDAQRRPEAYLRRTGLWHSLDAIEIHRSTKAGGVPPANLALGFSAAACRTHAQRRPEAYLRRTSPRGREP